MIPVSSAETRQYVRDFTAWTQAIDHRAAAYDDQCLNLHPIASIRARCGAPANIAQEAGIGLRALTDSPRNVEENAPVYPRLSFG